LGLLRWFETEILPELWRESWFCNLILLKYGVGCLAVKKDFSTFDTDVKHQSQTEKTTLNLYYI
jgi:hypothetical protein